MGFEEFWRFVEKCKARSKAVSVKMKSGQMHLNAADHVGAAVLTHVVRSAHMHLTAVIFI